MLAALSGVTGGLLALSLGVGHAVEPDHLAAVSTLVADLKGGALRRRVGRAALLGVAWGAGHTLAILGVGLVITALRATIPGRLDDAFELVVAATLLFLGTRAIARAIRAGRSGPARLHAHGAGAHHVEHTHEGPHDHVHLGRVTLASQPLVVGILHGLAGSGALAASAFAAMPSHAASIAFLLLFGAGATIGMAAAAALGGLVSARLAAGRRASIAMVATAGVLSLALGAVKGWPLALRLLSP